MLALLKNNPVLNRLEVVGQFIEGDWADLPNGSRVSPAYDGWELNGYELKTIAAADPVPDGQHIVSTDVQMIDGVPKYVHVTEADQSILDDYKAAFDAHLDAVAKEQQYDNRLSIATYKGDDNPQWAAEAQAFLSWRTLALQSMFQQLADVQAGEAEPPTIEGFIAALPEIVWP